jgi:hypothetical protein
VREDIIPMDDHLLHPDRGNLRSPVSSKATKMLWTRTSLEGRVMIEDTDNEKAAAESWTGNPDKGIVIFKV